MIFKSIFLIFASTYGYAILIIASFILRTALADYDCSAKEDGWYYDPEFCHMYWRCIHGAAEEFECASGTAWDHHENRCNWIDSVDCTRAEKTTAKIASEDENDGEQESNEVEKNDDDDDNGDDYVDTRKKLPKKRKLPRKKNLDDENEADDHLYSLTVCQANLAAEAFCAGRDGFFADPDYCTRYYRCAFGVDQGFECPRGTAWDEETKSCAWIDQVNCEQKKIDYSTSTSTEDTTTSNKKSNTESSASLSSVASIKPPTNGKGSRDADSDPAIECQPTGIYSIADPSECSAYYQCDKGMRTKLNCPERQLFDADKHQCMEFERVFCGTRSVNLAEKNHCVNKRDGIHTDTERDCRFYYQCVSQNKIREAKCPGDLKFSSYTGKCGPASSAPLPCGTYIPGNAVTQYPRNFELLVMFILTIIFIMRR